MMQNKHAILSWIEQKKHHYVLLDELPGHFYIYDLEHHFLWCNKAQIQSGERIGCPIQLGLRVDEIIPSKKAVRQIRENNEQVIIKRSGRRCVEIFDERQDRKVYLSYKKPFYHPVTGAMQGVMGYSIDITEWLISQGEEIKDFFDGSEVLSKAAEERVLRSVHNIYEHSVVGLLDVIEQTVIRPYLPEIRELPLIAKERQMCQSIHITVVGKPSIEQRDLFQLLSRMCPRMALVYLPNDASLRSYCEKMNEPDMVFVDVSQGVGSVDQVMSDLMAAHHISRRSIWVGYHHVTDEVSLHLDACYKTFTLSNLMSLLLRYLSVAQYDNLMLEQL